MGFAGFVLFSGAGVVSMFRCYGCSFKVAVDLFFTADL